MASVYFVISDALKSLFLCSRSDVSVSYTFAIEATSTDIPPLAIIRSSGRTMTAFMLTELAAAISFLEIVTELPDIGIAYVILDIFVLAFITAVKASVYTLQVSLLSFPVYVAAVLPKSI